MMLTGNITTSASSLSEGILWDFKEGCLRRRVEFLWLRQQRYPRDQRRLHSAWLFKVNLVAGQLTLKLASL